MSRPTGALLAAAVAAAVLATSAASGRSLDPRIGDQLRAGGVVLVFRHAVTDQSHQDADPVVLSDCSTQRNLSARGRADARSLGRQVRRLRVRIGSVLASPFCRTLATARLAFGRATPTGTLLNTVTAAHDARWRRQIAGVRRLLGTRPDAGRVTVLVTHGSVVGDAAELTLEEGEALVFRPLGTSRFRLLGRILPDEWGNLRAPAGATAVRVQEYPVPAGSGPHDVAPARDGTVWYTAQGAGKLGRLDPADGKVREVALGEGSAPHGVVIGPDGAPWATDPGQNAIVRVDPRTLAVRRFPVPTAGVGVHTPTFDRRGILWFTGNGGFYGRLDPRTGAIRVFRAPGGSGPYGITTTPRGVVWFASLAQSYIARIDARTGRAAVLRPPTPGQGARRIWSDSRGRLWVSEWNAGRVACYDPDTKRWREWKLPGAAQPYAVFVDAKDIVWLSDFGAGALVRFDPTTGRFTPIRLRPNANVRQLAGRPGEVWGAESGTDRLVVVRS